MKTEDLLIIGGILAAGGAVAYFGGFIPNTAPYLKKQSTTANPIAGTTSNQTGTTANTIAAGLGVAAQLGKAVSDVAHLWGNNNSSNKTSGTLVKDSFGGHTAGYDAAADAADLAAGELP